METKPYNLQSPEQIAKDYAGNKQKIAEAMQMGILDPTAGTLAAMFIDRMRQAAQAEAVPEQSVAQQVFAPPAPQAPMGLGAAPPMNATPPMDAVPAGLGATPEAAMMAAPEAAPMGMAAGGYLPPYASGGLSSIPLPDDMFDENRNGGFNDGYRGGGLVAFVTGGEVKKEDEDKKEDEIIVEGREDPESYYGFYKDPELNKIEVIEKLAPRQTKYSDQLSKFYEGVMDPEERRKRRKEDMWMALGQIGAKMASTPGSIFQAASAGIGEALPGVLAAAKERRAEQRDAIKTLAQQEGLNNKEAREVANLAVNMSGKYGEYRESDLNRKQQLFIEKMQDATQRYNIATQAGVSRANALTSAGATMYGDNLRYDLGRIGAANAAAKFFDDNLAETPAFKRLRVTNPQGYAIARQNYINNELKTYAPARSGGRNYSGFSAEPTR